MCSKSLTTLFFLFSQINLLIKEQKKQAQRVQQIKATKKIKAETK
jgi:hypothetical protein